MCLKFMPSGLTQKWSVSSGSRAVMWPAVPSSKPKAPKMRKAAARRCLRCRRSSSTLVNFGNLCGLRSLPMGAEYLRLYRSVQYDRGDGLLAHRSRTRPRRALPRLRAEGDRDAGAARLGGGAVPDRPAARDGRAGPARHAGPRGVGRHRDVHRRLRGGDGADRAGRPVGGRGVAGARDDRVAAALPVRHRRPARALAAPAGRGSGARRLRAHRARRRIRRPGHLDPSRAARTAAGSSTGARRSSRTPAPTCPSA